MSFINRKPRQSNRRHWEQVASLRRMTLLAIVLSTTLVATGAMAYVLPYQGRSALEFALLLFFAMLFGWISIGFWTSVSGFLLLLRKSDRWKVVPLPHGQSEDDRTLPATAVLMPIFNEDTDRVFAGLTAIYRSVEETGRIDDFEFFILSDSSDPNHWLNEQRAWYGACRQLNAFGRIFYRHRHPNIKRKNGNIADFCRRWGRRYTYMIVLDADSLMSGDTMVDMVRCMEDNEDVGILQTPPMLIGKNSLLARLQQFSNHMYGPMFAAGLHFWQLGDGQYWGHNAIIRIAPFMRHCALPRLSGRPPMGGDIMSHDFVESALMRQAGWGVWLAYDIQGSYEETPSTLIDELLRDRRWCQGNLQHLRLLLNRGLLPAHRFLFLNGAMSYISALLWFCSLSLSTVEAVSMALFEPDYFPREGSLFPDWPVWDPSWMIILLASTMMVLFIPKSLGLFLSFFSRKQLSSFGGGFRSCLSVAAEILFSATLAPIRMLTHSKFVAVTLLGGTIDWNPANRNEGGTSWREALRFHLGGSILALIWGLGVFLTNRGFFWWITPVCVPLVLAVPISVCTSKIGTGQLLKRLGLFLTPTELVPPAEMNLMNEALEQATAEKSATPGDSADEFVRLVVHPGVLRLHTLVRRGQRRVADSIDAKRNRLVHRALRHGPNTLTAEEKMQLLCDPHKLQILHEKVWALPAGDLARKWGLD